MSTEEQVYSNDELIKFLSQPGNLELVKALLMKEGGKSRVPTDQQESVQSMPALEEPIEISVEAEERAIATEAAVGAANQMRGMEPHEDIPALNNVFEESSSGTRRVPADAPEVVHDVKTSTGRVPRDQEEPNNNNAEQSQRSRRTFMSQITALSTTLSVLSWISAQWTSMINYWNGLGVFSREVIHILQVIGVRDVIEIREIIHELGTNNIIDLVSIQKDEWLQACQVAKISVSRSQRLWTGVQAFRAFYENQTQVNDSCFSVTSYNSIIHNRILGSQLLGNARNTPPSLVNQLNLPSDFDGISPMNSGEDGTPIAPTVNKREGTVPPIQSQRKGDVIKGPNTSIVNAKLNCQFFSNLSAHSGRSKCGRSVFGGRSKSKNC